MSACHELSKGSALVNELYEAHYIEKFENGGLYTRAQTFENGGLEHCGRVLLVRFT